jgi:hypothetical protein
LGRTTLEPGDLADQQALVRGDGRRRGESQEHNSDLDDQTANHYSMADT